MAKPWERPAKKPWERADSAPAPVAMQDQVPLPVAPGTVSKGLPEKSWWQSFKDTVSGDPVLQQLLSIGKTTTVGAPEVAGAMLTNTASQALAGVTAPFAEPLSADRAADFIRNAPQYQIQGENAKELAKGLGYMLEPVSNLKEATLGRAAEAVNQVPGVGPALATAIDTAPDVALAVAGAPKAKATFTDLRPKGSQPVNARSTSKTDWDVAHKVDEDTGLHELSTPNGTAMLQESGPYLKMERIDVEPAARRQGQSTAMIVRNVEEAEKRGLTASSGTTVTAAQAAVYENLKKNPKYIVHENPNSPGTNGADPGSRVSADPRKPVFEVRSAKPKENKNATQDELHDQAVETLLKNDVRLTTEQRGKGYGAKQAGSIGRAADLLIGKSKLAGEQLQDFTAAVLRKVGVKGRNATPDAMAEAKMHAEELYEAAHNNVHVKMDGQFITDLNELREMASRNPNLEGKFEKMLDHILRKGQSGSMTAADATSIRSELGRIEGSSDSNISGMARDVKNALDEAALRSATPAQAKAMTEARRNYHWLKQIEGAIDQKGNFISPKKLLGQINKKRNRNEVVYGKGDQELVDLARAGAKVLPEAVGDSGTAARVMDVTKAAMIVTNPVHAAEIGSLALGGRLVNEARATRGTASQKAWEQFKKQQPPSPLKKAGAAAGTIYETEQQRKRRQTAEALRR